MGSLTRPARAFAPASVTGLFAPAVAEGAVSRGASFTLEDGVEVALGPADEVRVTVEGDPAPFEPVERVLDELSVRATVDVRPGVPLGCGFGASGAATLGTALAADAAFDLGRDRAALLEAAHRAELAAGTGQGDVFVQDRGGLVYSAGEGIERVAVEDPVEYASAGGIDTAEMLADEGFVAAASESGRVNLDRLATPPTMRALAERSRAFLDETGIATEFVTDRLEAVEAAGGAGSMALFGDTVFAVDVDGVLSERTRASTRGARLLD